MRTILAGLNPLFFTVAALFWGCVSEQLIASDVEDYDGGNSDTDNDSDSDSDSDADSDSDTESDSDIDSDAGPQEGPWLCDPSYQGTNDGCDCGCGATDPDCGSNGCFPPGCYEASCQYCFNQNIDPIPCIEPGPNDTCPEGMISSTDEVECTTQLQCVQPPTGYTGYKLDWVCPDGQVCCAFYYQGGSSGDDDDG